MRVSSIDVGSNAIRLVIIEIHKNGQWEQIKKFRAPLRLGTDVFENRKLQNDTLLQLAEIFKTIAKLNKKHKVEKTIALATSAMRDAENGRQAVSLIKKTSGIKLQIITGQEEARLIRNAVLKSKSNHFPDALLIDIGGGSAELTGLQNEKIVFSKSYPLGVVRLLSLKKKNVSVTEHCQKHLSKIKLPQSHFTVAVGTGGNFDAIARLKLSLLKKAPQTHLEVSELILIQKKWLKLSETQKLALGLRPDRVDVLDLALDLILMIVKRFKITKIKIPMTGLKEGSIHDLIS